MPCACFARCTSDFNCMAADIFPTVQWNGSSRVAESSGCEAATSKFPRTKSYTFRLIATHFGLTFRERRSQARRLVAIARPHAMTTVMLGDFNEWFWPSLLRGALARELQGRTQHETFHSWRP